VPDSRPEAKARQFTEHSLEAQPLLAEERILDMVGGP
jgi:hypothetical protein